jgi:hypothetical protein
MSQLSLFRPERPEPPRRPPDLPYIRKSLHSRLRTVRDAEIMPWSEGEMASWEKLFPELAAYLPADEAEGLTAEFAAQLARLRGAGLSSHSLAESGLEVSSTPP